MTLFVRILRVLRNGPRTRRWQAWGGIGLIAAAALFVLLRLLWELVIALAIFLAGVYLLGRAVRSSPPPSS